MDYRFDTIALTVSQHYRLLKTILSERTSPRPLTDEEARLADYLADVIETVAGKKLAGYCREHFRNGWTSGDLRSYKIKFVLIRLRDILKGDRRDELVARMDELTSYAEALAGCQADNKRRNRQAVAERAQRRAERQSRKGHVDSSLEQMLLFGSTVETRTIENPDKTAAVKPRRGIKKLRKSDDMSRMEADILKAEYGEAYDADDVGGDFITNEDACRDETAQYDDLDADYGWGTRGEYDYN